jgi:hypothetical protein
MSAVSNLRCLLFLAAAAAVADTVAPLAEGAEKRQLNIVAQRSFVDDWPITFANAADKPADVLVIGKWDNAYPLVIRSARELAAFSPEARNTQQAAADKDNANLQADAEQRLLTSLGLAEIDWEKQMVVAVLSERGYRRPPRWQFVSLTADTEALVVQVRSSNGVFGCGSPCAIAVVERFDGKVEFRGESTP